MKVVAYVRVSTDSQSLNNQIEQIQAYCKSQSFELGEIYRDTASGGSGTRNDFVRMLNDADQRKFDLLIVWSLDRMSREGISNCFAYFERLKKNGVAVKSLRDHWLDTRDEGAGQLMLAIFSWMAKAERQRIAERVKAGLDRAKREGKVLGRPKGSKDKAVRSKSGYHLRYAGRKKADRKLPRKKEDGEGGK